MIDATYPLISLGLSLAILLWLTTFVVRLSLRKSFTGYLIAFVWLFCLSAAGFVLINTGILPGDVRILLKAQNALLGLFAFSYAAIIGFALIENMDTKKKKTLARLPLIGVLLGWYLGTVQLAAAFALVEISIGFILAGKRNTHKYLWRAHLKALLPAALLAMYSTPAGAWFLAYLLWSLIFKLSAANATIVKDTALDYDKSSLQIKA